MLGIFLRFYLLSVLLFVALGVIIFAVPAVVYGVYVFVKLLLLYV